MPRNSHTHYSILSCYTLSYRLVISAGWDLRAWMWPWSLRPLRKTGWTHGPRVDLAVRATRMCSEYLSGTVVSRIYINRSHRTLGSNPHTWNAYVPLIIIWSQLYFSPPSQSLPNMSIEKDTLASQNHDDASEINLYSFHEEHAGRLIIDPAYVIPIFSLLMSSHWTCPRV